MLDNNQPMNWEELNAQFFNDDIAGADDERDKTATVESNTAAPFKSFPIPAVPDPTAMDSAAEKTSSPAPFVPPAPPEIPSFPSLEDLAAFSDSIADEPSKESEEIPSEAGTAAEVEKPIKAYKQSKAYRVVRIVSNIIFYGLLIFMLVGSAVFAFSNNPNSYIFGYRFYNVLTDSMNPAYYEGDLLFVKATDPASIKEQDVITFNPGSSPENYLTHRVIAVHPDYMESGYVGFETKGDNNPTPDSWVTREDKVIGVVTGSIRYGGWVVSYVQDNWLLIIVMIVLLVSLFILLRQLLKKPEEATEQPRGDKRKQKRA